MAEKNMNAKISVEFEETANRQQLSSGDNLPTLFGKIKKFFTDLKPVAMSGSYNDLSDKPIMDSELDVNSENLIQNKAVAEALKNVNADTVDGKHSSDFILQLGQITDVDYLNNPTCREAYECVINEATAAAIGLPACWWHIKYLRHANVDGYGCQIVFPLNHPDTIPYYRTSNGLTWQHWKYIADGGNADTLDGLHASSLAKATVLSTIDQVNDPRMESGIYTVEGVGMTFPTVTCSFSVLIVNKHLRNPGYNTQIAIPYENGGMYGVFYRNCAAGTWGAWQSIGNGCNADTLDGYHRSSMIIPYGYYTNADGSHSRDLNELNYPSSWLAFNDSPNAPPNATGWGTVLVYTGGTGSIVQLWVDFDGVLSFIRSFNGNSWSAWKNIVGESGGVQVARGTVDLYQPSSGTHVSNINTGFPVKMLFAEGRLENAQESCMVAIGDGGSGFVKVSLSNGGAYFSVRLTSTETGCDLTVSGNYSNQSGTMTYTVIG